MPNDDFIMSVMSTEDIDEYLKEIAKGDNEYEKNIELDSKIAVVKEVRNNIESSAKMSSMLLKEYNLCDGLKEGSYIRELLSLTKKNWELLKRLYETSDHKDALRYDERAIGNDMIMNGDDIIIDKGYNGYHIIFPVLLPRKKMQRLVPDYANSYRMPIYNAFMKHFGNKRPFFNTKVSVLIVHNFSGTQNFIDYDNFDYSHLINCLSGFFIRDDDPDYYDLHIYGRATKEDHSYTELFLSASSKFDNVRLQFDIK